MTDEVRVTVIATGFSDPDKKMQSIDSVSRMQEFLTTAPSASMAKIEMPAIPSFQQPQMVYPSPQMPAVEPSPVAAPISVPPPAASYSEVAEGLSPVPAAAAPVVEAVISSRDMLIAKAKAFKEGQHFQQKHHQPEQLTMNVDPNEQQSLDEARRIAREVLSSPFANQNLEVPAFIRKRQGLDAP